MTNHGTQRVLPGSGPLLPEMPLPPGLPPEDDTPATTFVIEYDSRSDGGPRRVGPFDTREAAHGHADSRALDEKRHGWSASWCVVPVTSPEADI